MWVQGGITHAWILKIAPPGSSVDRVGLTQRHGSREQHQLVALSSRRQNKILAMLSLARKMSSISVPPAKALSQSSYLVTGTVPPIAPTLLRTSLSSRSPQES